MEESHANHDLRGGGVGALDPLRVARRGGAADSNDAVKSALGFADVQRFSQSLLDAVTRVASTSMGDDCGEGFVEPSPWARAFASLDGKSRMELPATLR
jgi:hypothetical protein